MIITIDGPAGSGKSTVARELSRRLDIPYLNSGAIYRSLTLAVLEAGGDFADEEKVRSLASELEFSARDDEDGTTRFYLGGREVTTRLKDPDVTREIFKIADNPLYRTWLIDLQRRAVSERGVVAEGRDMGTVIFPQAEVKFFLEAPARERARRQYEELRARGVDTSFDELLEQVERRDSRDRGRRDAPLRRAPDAVIVDSGEKSVEEVLEQMLAVARDRGAVDRPPEREKLA